MEHYTEIIKDTFENILNDGNETAAEILKRWIEGETRDDFGNMSGSRTCNAWQAEQDLKAAGFPFNSDINELFEEVGYNMAELLDRGVEVVDVIICELLAPRVAEEIAEEKGIEL